MKLAFNLQAAGFTPQELKTKGTITLEDGVITASHLELAATIEGITAEVFSDLVKDAEQNCPISKLLDTEITVTHTLNV
jgi:osmotically inducible protein OsmC